MGVKNHWEIKKTTKKQNVETNGGEKPLGNQKKTKETKCGDQWGGKTIGKSKKKKNKMWRTMALDPTIGFHILLLLFFWIPQWFFPPIGLHI